MVLTNFECWALGGGGGGSGVSADLDVAASRHVDPFNPRAVQQSLGPVPSAESTAGSHISSNGYYGFSHVNAAHEMNNNNNNNNVNLNNNNNNNNDETCHNNNNISAGGYVAPIPSTRCKKRFFVNDDALVADNVEGNHVADESLHSHGLVAAAKRCRYDDDFAAQYFNDFFTMQAAAQPIGTQACLMDTEDFSQFHQQQQQQHPATLQPQVDVAMTTSLQTNNDPTSNAYHSSFEQQQQMIQPHAPPQVQPPQQQQVHFQGHLHRTNRDVSRCMLSHMI